MSLARQSRSYLIIGGVQWLLDWAVMVGLSHLGLPVRHANIVGRICGALLGFWMNGRFTFAGEGTAVGRVQLQRFLVMWVTTTLVSTWAIGQIDDYLGLKWAWLAKPLVEIALGLIGFVISRQWIYRR
ncbi:GtrA family protein [Luteimonas abyssi]|uniref:GtrA family protein n=1 Tax=Luteimonas abyssi TaxID=1247514 RepID=UPI000737BA12|nr:GtrA family protein [Luteimonas abyssi]